MGPVRFMYTISEMLSVAALQMSKLLLITQETFRQISHSSKQGKIDILLSCIDALKVTK